MPRTTKAEVAKDDLLAAWMILEEVTVSLNQIGSAFAMEMGSTNGVQLHQEMLKALNGYLTPRVLHALNKARIRLGEYLPRKKLEQLSEHKIPYWNYAGLKRPRKRAAAAPKNRKRAAARR